MPVGVAAGGPLAGAVRKPANIFNIDLATPGLMESPSARMIGDHYKKGWLPLWNPYNATGSPLAAEYSTAALFPYQVLKNIAPWWLKDYFFLGRAWFAAVFTFLFLLRLGISRRAAFLGGAFYMLSGTFTVFLSLEQMANCAMVLPFLLWTCELSSAQRSARTFVLNTIAIACLLVAGQPEVALYCLLLGALFFFTRAGLSVVSLARFSGSFLLGFLLACPLLIPFLEYSVVGYHGHAIGGLQYGTMAITKAIHFFGAIFPKYFQFPNLVGNTPVNGIWDAVGGYCGSVVFALLCSGFLLGTSGRAALPVKQDRVYVLFVAYALFVFLKNMGIFPFVLLGRLPLFDISWSCRWAGPSWVFAAACAAALGYERIRLTQAAWTLRCRALIRNYAVKALLLAFGMCGLAILADLQMLAHVNNACDMPYWGGLAYAASFFGNDHPQMLANAASSLSIFALGLLTVGYFLYTGDGVPLILTAVLELVGCIGRAYDVSAQANETVAWVIGIFAILYYLKYSKKWGLVFSLAPYLYLAGFDLVSATGLPKRVDAFRPTPYVGFLKQHLKDERTFGYHNIMAPGTPQALGISDLRYANAFMVKEFVSFRHTFLSQSASILKGPTCLLWFTGSLSIFNEDTFANKKFFITEIAKLLPYYSFLAVKYFIMPNDFKGVKSRKELKQVYADDAIIFENTAAFPRSFILHDVECAAVGNAFWHMRRKGFDLTRTAVVEDAALPSAMDSKLALTPTTIELYEPNKVVINAHADKPGVLVLTDSFYPGWKAWVDGVESEIVRVNGLVRGVYLTEGRHEVVFKYQPWTFRLGLCAALISVMGMCALILSARLRRTS